MTISKKMQEALNTQLNKELYAQYLYLSMAAHFDSVTFNGFAHWMKLQAQEEFGHAMKIYNYIYERGGDVQFQTIEAPDSRWDAPLSVFSEAYEHEQKVTSMIYELVKLAREEGDLATESFLKWFVDEQVEEEASALTIVEKLKKIGDFKGGIIWLDKELGGRQS